MDMNKYINNCKINIKFNNLTTMDIIYFWICIGIIIFIFSGIGIITYSMFTLDDKKLTINDNEILVCKISLITFWACFVLLIIVSTFFTKIAKS